MLYDIITIVITLAFVGAIFKFILPGKGIKQLNIEELHERLRETEVQFIDVRDASMYRKFHIYRFENIPLRDIRKHSTGLDKDKKTVVICETGTKANRATKRLKRLGFTDVENVKRGITSWEPMAPKE